MVNYVEMAITLANARKEKERQDKEQHEREISERNKKLRDCFEELALGMKQWDKILGLHFHDDREHNKLTLCTGDETHRIAKFKASVEWYRYSDYNRDYCTDEVHEGVVIVLSHQASPRENVYKHYCPTDTLNFIAQELSKEM